MRIAILLSGLGQPWWLSHSWNTYITVVQIDQETRLYPRAKERLTRTDPSDRIEEVVRIYATSRTDRDILVPLAKVVLIQAELKKLSRLRQATYL